MHPSLNLPPYYVEFLDTVGGINEPTGGYQRFQIGQIDNYTATSKSDRIFRRYKFYPWWLEAEATKSSEHVECKLPFLTKLAV